MRGRFALTAVIAVAAAAAAGITTTALGATPLPGPPPVVSAPPPGPVTVDYGYDAAHAFAASDPSITQPLGSLWSVALGGDPIQLLAADKMVFALVAKPSADQPSSTFLVSLDPATGRPNWNLLVPNHSQIAYESGVVAVAGGDHVQAFKASSGAGLWSVALQGAAAVTPADGQLYVDAAGDASTAQTIEALNVTSGKLTWSAKPPSPTAAGPLGVAGDRLYRAEQNQAQAFDRTNGKLIWRVSNISTSSGAATAMLWNQRLFAPAFSRGMGGPAGAITTPPLSDSKGAAQTGQTAPIASGDTGLVPTSQGVIAYDLATGTLIWSAYTHPLAILNNDAVTWGKNAIELHSLASGKLDWSAQMGGTPANVVTAVGNGELLVGADTNVTALVPYRNSAAPKVNVNVLTPFATYEGASAKITGTISQPGIEQTYEYAIAGRPAGAKDFGTPRLAHTKPDGTLKLREHPKLDTIYRISLPGSAVPLSLFEIVALPRIEYHFGAPVGNQGQVTLDVTAPPQIRLGGHKASLYIGRPKKKRYFLLGTGHLHGKKRHFTATFPFKLEKHVGKRDFVTACFVGLYKQGMSYGDRLDRHCGAAKIRF